MKSFFAFIALFLTVCAAARAETAVADPDAPAPESPVKIRLLHSERTKDNIADSVADFMLTQFVKRFKGLDISYRFLEIDANRDLVLSDFKIVVNRLNVQGTFTAAKLKVDFSEVGKWIREQKFVLTRVDLNDVKADMTLYAKNGDAKRGARWRAREVVLNGVPAGAVVNDPNNKIPSVLTIDSAALRDAALSLSNPDEKFTAGRAELTKISMPNAALNALQFERAVVDGREYAGRDAFFKAARQ